MAGRRSQRSRTGPRRVSRRLGAGRVVLAGLLLVTAGAGAYIAARQTSVFALRRIEVEGASPQVAAEVRGALAGYVGQSLVRFHADSARRLLATVPEVAEVSFDRAFPHTLKVRVRAERPVAVVRQGPKAWLVSARARILRELDRRPYPDLPRIWLARTTDVAANATLGGIGAKGVAAVAPLKPLHVAADVRQVRLADDEVTLVLASGPEIRLGDAGDLRLKLAIAKRLLPLTSGAAYVDVSVPERPVAGYQTQVEG